MYYKFKQSLLVFVLLLPTLKLCCPKDESVQSRAVNYALNTANDCDLKSTFVLVKSDVTIGDYFQYIDSLVIKYDSITTYNLTEHLLVRSNPWIIDTLQNTDYYRMMAKDSFVYDQKKMVVLPKNAVITIPDSISASKILTAFDKTLIDINIPEFKLRIQEDSKLLYEFPVRVGKNEKKFLAMAGRIMDLRTKTGKGSIVSHIRYPDFYNPVDGHRYYTTRRDDQKVTKLPQIPFLETEINGIKYGQLIHITTNPVTLEKAYSNGCIGVKEADAWILYYYAPIGTKITIRYDLEVTDSTGQKIVLKDIYRYSKRKEL